MRDRRFGCGRTLAGLLVAIWAARACWAQAPTIEGSGTFQTVTGNTTPGSAQSLLGRMPGTSGGRLGIQPGSDEMFFGRLGPSAPRVPTSITTPGGVYQGPPQTQGVAAPQPLRAPMPPFYGTLEMPTEEEAVLGPPDGLTLDQAIDRLVHENLDLLAKQLRDPPGPRRCLDGQSSRQPDLLCRQPACPLRLRFGSAAGWPHSIRCQRLATDRLCPQAPGTDRRSQRRALEVQEAQFQDAIRAAIQNLYNTYVDVLAAQQTVIYAQVSVKGLDDVLVKTQTLYKQDKAVSADVDQAKSDREIAVAGLLDAEENLRQKKRHPGGTVESCPRTRPSDSSCAARFRTSRRRPPPTTS